MHTFLTGFNRLVITCMFFQGIISSVHAQVSISTTGAPPLSSAIYEVNSTTKGLLIPRMTSAQRNAISNPATGLMVYDLTLKTFHYYSGTEWVSLQRGVIAADADADTRIWVEKNPNEDLLRIDLAGSEAMVLRRNVSGVTIYEPTGTNVILGDSAGLNISTGQNNSLLGFKSGYSGTSGNSNVSLGYKSLYSNTIGNGNIAIGLASLYLSLTTSRQVAVGDSALYSITSSSAIHNVGIGHGTLKLNSAGYDNTTLGFRSGHSSWNNYNSSLGYQSAYSNSFGDNNSVAGFEAAFHSSFGDNTAVCGSQADYFGVFDSDIAVIGAGASYSGTDDESTVCGRLAQFQYSVFGVVALGKEALYSITSGAENVAIGVRAMVLNTSGARNCAIGDSSMRSSTISFENTAMGKNALRSNTNGKSNTVLGMNAMGNSDSPSSYSSNAYILVLALFCLLVLKGFNFLRKKSFEIPWRRFLIVAGLAIAGYFIIPFLHWSYSGQFYWSKVKSVFITNRVNQMGLLKPFLHEHCGIKTYRLCDSIDKIPYDLLWSPVSPLRKTGFSANDEEYGRMLNDFFREPYYVKKFILRSIENGIVQFFTIEGLVMTTEREEGYHYQVIEEELPEFIPSIRRSVQFSGKWNSHPTQLLQRFLVYGSILYLLGFFVFRKSKKLIPKTQFNLACFLLFGLIANAFICAGISMVDVRFQYRVVWIIPLFALFIFGEQLPQIVDFIKNKFANNNGLEEK